MKVVGGWDKESGKGRIGWTLTCSAVSLSVTKMSLQAFCLQKEFSNISLPLAPGLHLPLLLPERDELRLTENCSNGNGGFRPCSSMGTISECLQDMLYICARTNCMMISLKNMSNAGRALRNSFPWSTVSAAWIGMLPFHPEQSHTAQPNVNDRGG